MIEIHGILAEVDLDPVHLAAELRASRSDSRRSPANRIRLPTSQVSSAEKIDGLGLIHAPFAGLLAVHVQRDRAALRQAAAVVLELHPHLVRARRDRRRALDRVPVHAVEVVAVLRLAILGVEAPAANDPARARR